MDFTVAACTDAGIRGKINQDSIMVKKIYSRDYVISLGVVCDGVGGTDKGEIASSEMIRAFREWFVLRFGSLIKKGIKKNVIFRDWDRIIQYQNRRMYLYGKRWDITLGTTLSAVMVIGNQYFCVNVGDSRVYKIDKTISCITRDQTLFERELLLGHINGGNEIQLKNNHIILQCIGYSQKVRPDYYSGTLKEMGTFAVCSDGMYRKLAFEEIFNSFNPMFYMTAKDILNVEKSLVKLVKTRKEKDNISIGVIRQTQFHNKKMSEMFYPATSSRIRQ